MKITIEDIQTTIEEYGWKVISNEYKNLDTELLFECPRGHRIYTSWKKFRNKHECQICSKLDKLNNNIFESKSKSITRILCLDQATYKTGWSIFDNNQLVKYGVHEVTFDQEDKRLNETKNWLISCLTNWRPDQVYIEDIHFEPKKEKEIGITTYKVLAHLQGVLIDCLYENEIPYHIVSPSTWRHHCGIKGTTKTDKKRGAQLLVAKLYNVKVTEDEADAICIGKYGSEFLSKNYEMIEL